MASNQGQFKPTIAFRKKEEQLREAVEKEAKKKLQDDIGKLFQNPENSDLELHVGSQYLPVHSWILKARYEKFYHYCLKHCTEDNKVTIDNLSFDQLEKCLRSLYTKDTVDYSGDVDKALSLDSSTCTKQHNTLSGDMLWLLDTDTGDINFVVQGKIIKVYKAILASRSDYFAAMFSSAWKENSLSSVTIPDTTYEVFMSVLKFLYSACQDAVVSSNVTDVLQFSDMYGLIGLQNVVISHLKITKCHLFHKPCAYCIPQVYECLKICEDFNLELVKSQCIQWVGKYYAKTLNCKQFFAMSKSIQINVKTELEKQIDVSTALDMWRKCDELLRSVHSYQMKWAQELQDFVAIIQTTCIIVTIENFVCICSSPTIGNFLKDINYSSSLLEQCFGAIIDALTVQNCCKVLQGFLALIQMAQNSYFYDPFSADTFAVVEKSCKRCEKFVIGSIGQVTKTKAWKEISDIKQKELKDAGFFVHL